VGELRDRPGSIDLGGSEFRRLGHGVVDALADLLDAIPARPVTPGRSPDEVRAALGSGPLPERGTPPEELLREAFGLLADHSTFSGHPRFWAYIVGAPAPLGALGDLLAAGVNPNVGGWSLAPVATEIEAQTVRWIAELVRFPSSCGGLLVSGGNMANFVGFLCARRAAAGPEIRTNGTGPQALRVYGSRETHTWIQKAADLFGLGTDSIRWIRTDGDLRLDVDELRGQIAADRDAGAQPFLVVGAAGTVSTGAVDPLREIAQLCRDERLWFHVDGAYGAFAAALPDAPDDLRAVAEADSVALDPHKWLYVPVEAGCALVRDPQHLLDTFSYRPPYYHLVRADDRLNYFEYGPQNSRAFRALKVWLLLRHQGREGYVRSLGEDIALARELFRAVEAERELEAGTTNLSITTFRYVPYGSAGDDEYLNELNSEICTRLEESGEAYLSNAVVDGRFYLRACIVNFRTTARDVRALPGIVRRVGAEAHAGVRG
jgi:glutamate/tyrosine decarboxylase-like PLP-dependent enzyme